MGEAEDRCQSISVGGLAHDLGILERPTTDRLHVFGKLIEFARRAQRLTVAELARKADIDLGELVLIEKDDRAIPEPRTVYKLAETLDLPVRRLMELSGLTQRTGDDLKQAAQLFAARSEPTAKLSKEEKEAFEEFVKVLADATDGV
jgi:transcriptional regulator with XRE-family HTH domain